MRYLGKVKFLSLENGGRKMPPLSGYKPHLKIGDLFTTCTITTLPSECETMNFNIEHTVYIELQFESLFPDKSFLNNEIMLYEGEKLIGFGEFVCD